MYHVLCAERNDEGMKKISAIVIATVLIVAIPLTCAGASTINWLEVCVNYLVMAEGFGCEVSTDYQFEYDENVVVRANVDDIMVSIDKDNSAVTSAIIVFFEPDIGVSYDDFLRASALIAAFDYGRAKIGSSKEYRKIRDTYMGILSNGSRMMENSDNPFSENGILPIYETDDYTYCFMILSFGIALVVFPK